MKYLFIAEKPSLMREVQACYANHTSEINGKVGEIQFIPLAGHVCQQLEPNDYDNWSGKWDEITYPMVPEQWGVKGNSDKTQLINDLKEELKDTEGIIVGTDSDVEGYGIYYLLCKHLNLYHLPTLRFIEHSLTDKEILESLLTMTDFYTDPVHVRNTQAYKLRSRADWLYGMNATRLMTVQKGFLSRIGRVKAPTVKLVYDNSMAIDGFIPTTYYNAQAEYQEGFKSTLLGENLKPIKYEKPESLEHIPAEGVVSKRTDTTSFKHAPGLYDQPAIQEDAGKEFGYTPTKVDEILQSLYETHKIISYPRTQCRYVSSEKAKEFPGMLKHVAIFEDLKPYVDAITDSDIQAVYKDEDVVNDDEVSKESHDALLPTSKTPDLSTLTEEEKNVCKLIYKRLLAQFLPKLQENKSELLTQHGEYIFQTKGKVVMNQGWRVLYGDAKDTVLPNIQEGEPVHANQFTMVEKITKPPQRLTQSTLLAAMTHIASQVDDKELRASLAASKGIGTGSSRAKIIKDIIETGYVEDRSGKLYITQVGKNYVENLMGINIIDPTFAAIMDMEIKKIQRGEAEFDTVYKTVIDDLHKVCEQINKLEKTDGLVTKYQCLKCKSKNLINAHYSYKCPACDFKIAKSVCGKTIDEGLVDVLYSGKRTPRFTFKKKDNSTFQARLKLTESGLEYDFSSGITCPYCNKDVNANKAGYFCDCGLKIFNPAFGRKLTDADVIKLLKDKRLPKSDKYKKKDDGTPFSAILVLKDDKTTGLEFERKESAIPTDARLTCPYCGNNIRINSGGYFCDCGLKVFANVAGRTLMPEDVQQLFNNGNLPSYEYTSKAGNKFTAQLVLTDEKTTKFVFD